VYDQEGEISGWLLVFREVTEEVELERLRDEMTHMLVHDLRSPLTIVRGSLEMIEETAAEGDVESVDRLVELARRSSGDVLRMVNQLLDISKLESGQLVIKSESVQVERLIENTASQYAGLAAQARITLARAVEPGLPPLHADPELIVRVLSNLVDNALKFTPDDGHVLLWAKEESTVEGRAVAIGVSDDGPGVPESAKARLFRKFEQVVSTEGRRRGTGLGLPFCKLAVEAHGGEIWVESPATAARSSGGGAGSTFAFRLPATMEEAVP